MDLHKTEQWVSIREAAEHLGLSVAFLRKAVRLNRVPHARAGSKVLRNADLDRWLKCGGTGGEVSAGKVRNGERGR